MKKDIITEQQRNSYIETGANSCPFCGSPHIEGGQIDIDSCFASQEVSCTECHKEWHDIYTLSDVQAIY